MNKRILKSLFLGALAILAGNELCAQEMEKARLGYCVDAIGSGLIAQTDQPSEYHAAIKLPNSILKKYVGNKITTIDFAILQKPGREMTLFISRELGGEPLVSQTISDFKEGWNSIKLKRSYTIAEKDELYVGYVFYTEPSTVNAQVITFDGVKGRTSGVNYFGDRGIWNEVSPLVDYDLAIRAFVEGEKLPHNDVQIYELSSNDYIVQNTPTSAKVTIWNFGLDEVSSMDVEFSANGKPFDTKNLRNISVPHNSEVVIDVEDISFPEEGNNSIEVKVLKVNDKEDSDSSDNFAQHNLYAVKEGAEPAERLLLVEQFCTEGDEKKPEADKLYEGVISGYGNVASIKHHVDDQFALSSVKSYKRFFDNNRMFFPALMVDRTVFNGMEEFGPAYFINYTSVLEDMIDGIMQIPSYIKPEISLNYDDVSRKLSVDITGKAGVKEMPFQKSLRLTVYLVENKVYSTSQKGTKEYYHDGVVRAIVSQSCWGDEIDITSYSFEKTYEVSLDKNWNPDNLSVVAVVSNYDEKDNRQLQIYNSAVKSVVPSMIENLTDDHNEPQIWVVDGRIYVEDGYDLLNICDYSGAVKANVGLSSGIYIVSVTDGKNNYHKKVMVE